MSSTSESEALTALASLLDEKGLTASDFLDAINAVANIKKREAETAEKSSQEPEKKIYQDKEFVYETRTDVFIYRDGRTKSGRYYVRIYDEKTKRDYVKSLKTSNRIEALASAEKEYRENKDRMKRGVKLVSLNTRELINIYLKLRFKERTDTPHSGITTASYDKLINKLKYWQTYIEAKKHKNTKLENLPPELATGFGQWMLEQPKQFYKDRERSKGTINSIISAIKKMYRDVALHEKYITFNEMPKFKYLKVPKDDGAKRDILEKHELEELRHWMEYKWCREKEIDELEVLKRKVFCCYLAIKYFAGFRNKEILGLKWCDVSPVKTESKERQKVNRAMFIPASNSKNGKSRSCVAPVAYQFQRIKDLYTKNGIEVNRDDYVFINLAKTKRGLNIPYQQPAMINRLESVLVGSGLQKKLDETGRRVTEYSSRHYAITDALLRGVSIYDVALNTGTSIQYIQSTYSHCTALLKSEAITNNQEEA